MQWWQVVASEISILCIVALYVLFQALWFGALLLTTSLITFLLMWVLPVGRKDAPGE